jgi:hypothetical protein
MLDINAAIVKDKHSLFNLIQILLKIIVFMSFLMFEKHCNKYPAIFTDKYLFIYKAF